MPMLLRHWIWLLLLLAIAVRLPTMFSVQRTGWDERAYAVFAKTVDEGGVAGIRKWMQDYPTNESLQKSPLLLRIGFIAPAMLTCKLLGGFTPDSIAWLSFAAGIGLIVLGAHFTELLAGRKIAIICGILLITSPLAAGLSRRGTQDTFAALLFVACLYFFHNCWTRRAIVWPIALAGCLTLAWLTKESALLLYPLMLVAALYYQRVMHLQARYWLLVSALAIAPLIYFAIEFWICDGIGNFLETYRTYSGLQNKLEYTVHYEKGPWFRYLVDLVAIAPAVFTSGIVGLSAPVDESSRNGRSLALIYLAGGLLLFSQMPIINVRLVLFADMFLRLGAVLGASYLASLFAAKWARGILVVLIALLVVNDSLQFYRIFVAGNLYSPTTFLLLRSEGFYP
ncbi:MAG TPA: glycosyltransferase family 39 protein [Chthoniobacterales bacterium]|nr:glycosyltransferase family 39 protein [Chthoniobacterales bacterium]